MSEQRFHIPSLTGLRAVAVLIVFVGHCPGIPEDWPAQAGVTIFFFLSGFLIVTLLRREWDLSGRIAMGKFYLRRVLRILPPLYVAIALCTLVGAAGILPATTNVGGVIAEMLNVTNYYLIVHGREGLPPQSAITWSLAVEEHYYLVIPGLLAILFARRQHYVRVGWFLIGIALAVTIWRLGLWASGASYFRLYTATDTRIDSLLWGSAMALMLNPVMGDRPTNRLVGLLTRPWAAGLGVGVILLSFVPIGAMQLTVGDTARCLALVPIFWHLIARADGYTGRFLNHEAVVHVGVLSYCLYLFHRLSLGVVEEVIGNPWLIALVGGALAVAISQVVHVVVEKPSTNLRRRLEAGRRTNVG